MLSSMKVAKEKQISGLDFAFMILGKEAKRGVFSRRSQLTTQGKLTDKVSSPVSTSLVTNNAGLSPVWIRRYL